MSATLSSAQPHQEEETCVTVSDGDGTSDDEDVSLVNGTVNRRPAVPANAATSGTSASLRVAVGILVAAALATWIVAIVLVATSPAAARHDVVVPSTSKAQYRATTLRNGIKVLLVSSPAAPYAAAAMDVGVRRTLGVL